MNAVHRLFSALALALALLPGVARALPDGDAPADLPPLDTGEPIRVGLYPLERVGPADAAYDRLQKDLLKSLANFPHTESFDLATPNRCRADDLKCLVSVGRLAAADHVVHGSVERFGDGYAVRLQLIDVGRTTRREAKRLIQGGGPDLSAAMESAACELMTSERCIGTLKIDGVPGARVIISARDLGETPWTGTLPVGRHGVRVAKGALSTEDKFVNVSFHQTSTLSLVERAGMLSFSDDVFDNALLPAELLPPELKDVPPPPVAAAEPPPPSALALPVETAAVAPPIETDPARPTSAAWVAPAFWGSLIGSGVCLVVGMGFGLGASSAAAEANGRFDRRELTAADKSLYEAAGSRATVANVSYGLTALGLAAAGVFFALDPDAVRGGGAK